MGKHTDLTVKVRDTAALSTQIADYSGQANQASDPPSFSSSAAIGAD
jgi:hypothetical protein